MKSLIGKITAGWLLISVLSVPAWGQARIATIDLRKVFDKYYKTQQADATIKERAAEMEKDFKEMVTKYEKAKTDYQGLLAGANDQAISAEEREKRNKSAADKLKELKDKEEEITAYKRSATTQLDEQKKRMRDNILTEIRTVLNAKAKAAGFALVVDTAAESINSTPIVLYTNNEHDMTDEVLKQLNVGAPADAAKVDVKKDDKTDEKKKGR
jgi:outer membrane protein